MLVDVADVLVEDLKDKPRGLDVNNERPINYDFRFGSCWDQIKSRRNNFAFLFFNILFY